MVSAAKQRKTRSQKDRAMTWGESRIQQQNRPHGSSAGRRHWGSEEKGTNGGLGALGQMVQNQRATCKRSPEHWEAEGKKKKWTVKERLYPKQLGK